MMRLCILMLSLVTISGWSQQLPDGPGREETERVCKQCHELARSISLRQDKDGWANTITKMVAFGMKGTDKEFALVTDYLAKNYPADDVPKINVNTATAIQLESGLSLRRSQAAAVLAYRAKNGNFSSIDDLKKVPELAGLKLETKKDRIIF